MPTGVYVRTKEQLALLKSYSEIAHKRPITEAQRAARRRNGRKVGKLPKTQTQIEASRRNGSRKGQPGRVFRKDLVCHHNDGCHGKLRPDDITQITLSEHGRLHAEYRERDNMGRFI